MKSAIYSPYLDSFGGGERYILTIAEYLVTKGETDILWDGQDLRPQLQTRFHIDLMNTKMVPNIFHKSLFDKIKTLKNYDVLVYLSDGSFPFGFAKTNILHLQVPFTFSGGRSMKNMLKLKTWQKVIVNSQFTKAFIDKTFGTNATVLYPPVDIEAFSFRQKEKIIVSVGRFVGGGLGKRQDVLIDVFKKIHDAGYTDWQLVLIGGVEDQAYFDELTKRAQNYPIQLLPDISFDELKNTYSKAAIYWHAKGFDETKPEFMEHFGISTVEAMAAGCIPIVYDGGGQKEIVRNTENGVLWKTAEELKKLTEELLADEAKRNKLANNAVASSKRFSKEQFINQFKTLIT